MERHKKLCAKCDEEILRPELAPWDSELCAPCSESFDPGSNADARQPKKKR